MGKRWSLLFISLARVRAGHFVQGPQNPWHRSRNAIGKVSQTVSFNAAIAAIAASKTSEQVARRSAYGNAWLSLVLVIYSCTLWLGGAADL